MKSSSIPSDLPAGRHRVAGMAARPLNAALLAAVMTAGLGTTAFGQQSYSAIGGVVDDFTLPTDPASPDAELLTFLQGTGNPVVGFDQQGAFGHTFDNLPQNVVGATVTTRLKATGGNPGNDLLYFERLDDPGIWCTVIGDLPEAGGGWSQGNIATFSLDLDNLADFLGRTSVIDRINADGSLDVYIQDDSAVDYLTLSLTTEESTPAGVLDGCGSGADPASPDAELLTFLQGTGNPVANFDQPGAFGHTFDNLPENVVSATLEVHLSVARNGSGNDLFYLERLDTTDGIWCSSIANLPEAGGTWSGTQSMVVTLDLANLPDYLGRTSVLDRINADGSLDIYIQDDTCVDSMTLTVRTAETVITSGFDVQPTGDAVVTSDGSGGLVISNFGPTGGDGFDVNVCNGCGPNGFGPTGWVSGYVGCLYSAISDGDNWYSIAWQTDGVWYSDFNPQTSRIEFVGDSVFQTVQIAAVFNASYAVSARYEVLQGTQVVHSETAPITNGLAPTVGIGPCALVDTVSWSRNFQSLLLDSGWRVKLGGSETLEMPSGLSIAGNELRIAPVINGVGWLNDGVISGGRFSAVQHSPVQIDDLEIEAGGVAISADSGGRIAFDDQGMHLTSVGSTASYDMRLEEDGGGDLLRMDFVPFALDQAGQSIQTAGVGTLNGVPNSALGHTTLVNNAGTLEARADFSVLGSTDVRLQIFIDGKPAYSEIVANGNGGVAAILDRGTLEGDIVDKGSGNPVWEYHLLNPVLITANLGPLAGAAPVLGDEIRLSPVDPTALVDSLESVDLTAENVDEIVITDIIVPNPCPTDVDGDGTTGFSDLTALLNNWGPCPAPCAFDVDGDEAVGFSDLTALLNAWGDCS